MIVCAETNDERRAIATREMIVLDDIAKARM
jgi:hypothetical protein